MRSRSVHTQTHAFLVRTRGLLYIMISVAATRNHNTHLFPFLFRLNTQKITQILLVSNQCHTNYVLHRINLLVDVQLMVIVGKREPLNTKGPTRADFLA